MSFTLAYLHEGETCAALAVGFGVSTSTAYRRANETIALVAARAPGLGTVLRRAGRRGLPFVILDGRTLHRLRCSPHRATDIVRAITIINHTG